MAYECFELKREAGIAHIVLNRPAAMNAMNLAFWRELPQIVRLLEAEGGTRVAVLSATGKHFTAGMDLSVFAQSGLPGTATPADRERFRLKLVELQQSFSVLADARFPVIAAVHGACIGGGVDLVSACCLRYATQDAYFTIQEINLAMMADVGTLQRMPKAMPEAVVRELAYTGDKLPAARAHQLGWVNGTFDSQAALLEGAMAVAKRIAAKHPMSVAASKEMISYSRDHSVADSYAYLNARQPGLFDIDAVRAAASSARGAEPPKFEDLPPKAA
jgi:enoyl-CoA hydratase